MWQIAVVEEPGVLIDREFSEGLFNELFGRAGVIIPLAVIEVVHPRRRDRHCIGTVAVLKHGRVVIQEPAIFPRLGLCLTADRIARNAIPRSIVFEKRYRSSSVLQGPEKAQLRVGELGRF